MASHREDYKLKNNGTTLILAVMIAACGAAQAGDVHDPGVRGGTPGAGGSIGGLDPPSLNFFQAARNQFAEVEGVAKGLGPRFNLDSCGGCHSQPAIGGTSPSISEADQSRGLS